MTVELGDLKQDAAGPDSDKYKEALPPVEEVRAVPGRYDLRLNNDTGSVYEGTFIGEIYTTITLTTTDGRWQVVLTKA